MRLPMPFIEPGWRRCPVRTAIAICPRRTSWTPERSPHQEEEPKDEEREEEEEREERAAPVGFDHDRVAGANCRSIGVRNVDHLGRMPRSPITPSPIPGCTDCSGNQYDENNQSNPWPSHGYSLLVCVTYPTFTIPQLSVHRSLRPLWNVEAGSDGCSAMDIHRPETGRSCSAFALHAFCGR